MVLSIVYRRVLATSHAEIDEESNEWTSTVSSSNENLLINQLMNGDHPVFKQNKLKP